MTQQCRCTSWRDAVQQLMLHKRQHTQTRPPLQASTKGESRPVRLHTQNKHGTYTARARWGGAEPCFTHTARLLLADKVWGDGHQPRRPGRGDRVRQPCEPEPAKCGDLEGDQHLQMRGMTRSINRHAASWALLIGSVCLIYTPPTISMWHGRAAAHHHCPPLTWPWLHWDAGESALASRGPRTF